MNHYDKFREILNKFNALQYNKLISKSLNKDENYQQYLYSYSFGRDPLKNENNSDITVIATEFLEIYDPSPMFKQKTKKTS